jgi:hypothetical protein
VAVVFGLVRHCNRRFVFPGREERAPESAAEKELQAQHFIPDVPVNCNDARGKIDDDYYTYGGDKNCWYHPAKFRTLYPEYKDLPDDQLYDRLYAKAEIPLPHPSPWTLVLKTLSIAIGVPLIVLALGSAIGWSFAGFFGETRQ